MRGVLTYYYLFSFLFFFCSLSYHQTETGNTLLTLHVAKVAFQTEFPVRYLTIVGLKWNFIFYTTLFPSC